MQTDKVSSALLGESQKQGGCRLHRRKPTSRVAGMSRTYWRVLITLVTFVSVSLPGRLDAASPKNKKEEDSYTIGGVLSGYESEKHFRETIEVRSLDPVNKGSLTRPWPARLQTNQVVPQFQHLRFDHLYAPRGTHYDFKTIQIDRNPIKTALNVCKHLIAQRVRTK